MKTKILILSSIFLFSSHLFAQSYYDYRNGQRYLCQLDQEPPSSCEYIAGNVYCPAPGETCSYIAGDVYCGYHCSYIAGDVHCAERGETCSYIAGAVYCGTNCRYIAGNVHCSTGGRSHGAPPATPSQGN